MKFGQQRCLLRYSNHVSSASEVSHEDRESAALVILKSFLAVAGVVPADDHATISCLLLDEGVTIEIRFYHCITSL